MGRCQSFSGRTEHFFMGPAITRENEKKKQPGCLEGAGVTNSFIAAEMCC